MRRRSSLFLAGCCFLVLAGCGEPSSGSPLPLPTGLQTMTGTLLPAEISTLRRGTHLLTDQGQPVTFVESTTVNLRSFEGKTVVIRGVFEPNADPSLLPVLVTQDVQAVEKDSSPFSLPAYGLSGTVPRAWVEGTQQDRTVFFVEGSTLPLVTIALKKQTPLPARGAPFLITGHHAVREITPGTNAETTSVERGDDLIVLTYTPPDASDNAAFLHAQWTAFLTSLALTDAASSSANAGASVSSAPAGQPCGGTAGILCPEGQYCAIEDLAENIGHCRAAK